MYVYAYSGPRITGALSLPVVGNGSVCPLTKSVVLSEAVIALKGK
jgi:hypothetical protein